MVDYLACHLQIYLTGLSAQLRPSLHGPHTGLHTQSTYTHTDTLPIPASRQSAFRRIGEVEFLGFQMRVLIPSCPAVLLLKVISRSICPPTPSLGLCYRGRHDPGSRLSPYVCSNQGLSNEGGVGLFYSRDICPAASSARNVLGDYS